MPRVSSCPAFCPAFDELMRNAPVAIFVFVGEVGAAEGCDLLILIFSDNKAAKIKRSQPSAAPTQVVSVFQRR
jgi:hypothetical protein